MLAILAIVTSTLSDGKRSYHADILGHSMDFGLGGMILFAVILVLVRGMLSLLEADLIAGLNARYEQEKKAEFVSAFLGASWPVQEGQRSNEAQDVVTTAVAYGRLGVGSVASAVGACFSTLVMLTGAFIASWAATLGAIALSLLLTVGVQPLVRRSKTVGARVRDLSLEYVAAFGETVKMAREIRLADVGESFFVRLGSIGRSLEGQRKREQRLSGVTSVAFETGALLIVVAGLAALYYFALADMARFIAMLLLLLRASQYARGLQGSYRYAKSCLPFLDVIDERENLLLSSKRHSGDTEIHDFDAIELHNVSYGYGADQTALCEVNLRIVAGDVIGIIGPSGSGKSTLVELLLGLREPISGHYLIDGKPQSELDQHLWHRLTGLVTQEVQLVEGDLVDNVRFCRSTVTDSDVDEAVEASGLAGDLSTLPAGLKSRIGPRSSGLSGGQRQRLSIARVLAGHPRLLILDEPTSALDVHAEAVITESLERLKGSTTIVVVAHRLSTLRVCDKVLVLRDGKVEAFAPRLDLERDNAYYSAAIELAHLTEDA